MPYLLIFSPLLGSILGYFAKPLGDRYSEIITTSLVVVSATLSCIIFYNGAVHDMYGNYKILDWINSGNFKVMYYLASLYSTMKKYDEALELFNKVKAIKPDYQKVQQYLDSINKIKQKATQ